VGFEAEDVRDVGLRGSPDEAIFERAQTQNQVILTADLGFGNILRFPLDQHHGVLVARFPNETSTEILNEAIVAAIRDLHSDEIDGHLLIVEPGRVRLRRG